MRCPLGGSEVTSGVTCKKSTDPAASAQKGTAPKQLTAEEKAQAETAAKAELEMVRALPFEERQPAMLQRQSPPLELVPPKPVLYGNEYDICDTCYFLD